METICMDTHKSCRENGRQQINQEERMGRDLGIWESERL